MSSKASTYSTPAGPLLDVVQARCRLATIRLVNEHLTLADRKLVRKSAWSSELGPALIAVPLILWLPKSDIADDLESVQVRCEANEPCFPELDPHGLTHALAV